MSEPTPPQTLEEYKAALEAEWGRYVAAEAIEIGNARAFNPGDPVPVSHVKAGLVDKSAVSDSPSYQAAKSQASKSADTKTESKG